MGRPAVLTRFRRALLWQDSLLSLSFDRPPARSCSDNRRIYLQSSGSASLGYVECMHHYCDIGRHLLERPRSERASIDIMWFHLRQVDEVLSKSAPHLRSLTECTSRQSRMEHHAFRLQASSCASFICRPALLSLPVPGKEAEHSSLLARARHDLLETIHAFLDLQTLTVLPLRTWAMIHASISAGLLLRLIEDSEPSEEVRELLNALVSAIFRNSGTDDLGQPGLSVSHLRALRILRGALTRERSDHTPSAEPTTNTITHGQGVQTYGYPDSHDTYNSTQVTSLFSDAEMAELSLDNFGNIEWGMSD